MKVSKTSTSYRSSWLQVFDLLAVLKVLENLKENNRGRVLFWKSCKSLFYNFFKTKPHQRCYP